MRLLSRVPWNFSSGLVIIGVRITYRWHGRVYPVTAWFAGVADGDQFSFNPYGQLTDQAWALTIKQAS